MLEKEEILENKPDPSDIIEEENRTSSKENVNKIGWYYAPGFLLFWIVLFVAVVLPLFHNLPKGLKIQNEKQNLGKFIAERAERILIDFDMIGPKVTGSYANENLTVQLLYNEVEKIRQVMLHDLYDLELDVQVVSGAYMHWSMMNMYQALQNFVVKLSCKNSTSQNYLLINSHFDSKTGSPGAGDDGAMVVIMLEVLRVLATNRETFEHPIVFLFNGAEENPLQASHGFITQHKWAKNCKALINLDAAGSGNREILFQSGPNHPWLMKYYSKYIVKPFATSMAEELFQANIIQSDTDFRIFRDYGNVPGLDFAHFYNGYIYHTEFDRYHIIPRGTLQATGNNILSLVKGLANAPELKDTEQHADGLAVFYDYLGLFFVCYSMTQAQIINTCISSIVLIAVGVSLWSMSTTSNISFVQLLKTWSILLILHIVGLGLALGLPILMAVIFDSGDHSMTWFTSQWLVFGLYVCPALIAMALPAVLFLSFDKNDKLNKHFKIQLLQHAHALLLSIICIVGTFMGLRSSYLLMMQLFFYGIALILNLAITFYKKGNFWPILIILSQVMPFIYISYAFLILLITLIPMMGMGGNSNPDILVSAICAMGTILSMGFVMHMWNMFRRPKILLLGLALVTFVFSMIAISPIGFPYRPKTNVGRVHYMNVRSVFYEYDGSVSRNISGYYFDYQDRRIPQLMNEFVDTSDMETMESYCDKYMMCGLPLFNHRMVKISNNGHWLPTKDETVLPGIPKLTLMNRTFNSSSNLAHFEFELSGPPHMSIFLKPMEGVKIVDWSFLKQMLLETDKFQPPYHIYATYGKLSTPMKFSFDFELSNTTIDKPLYELGISGHYVSFEYSRGKKAQEFLKQFPNYIHVMEWPSSYERYIF